MQAAGRGLRASPLLRLLCSPRRGYRLTQLQSWPSTSRLAALCRTQSALNRLYDTHPCKHGSRSQLACVGTSRGVAAEHGPSVTPKLDVSIASSIDGTFPNLREEELDGLLGGLRADATAAIQAMAVLAPSPSLQGTVELSLTLVDDEVIREVNAEFRGVDAPTDVLSFEMGSDEGEDDSPKLPVQVLGDILISLDTAARQAEERRHALEQELRVLLVHGLLHLLGHDHEEGPVEAAAMADLERQVLAALGWRGPGLIGLAEADRPAGGAQEPSPGALGAGRLSPSLAAPSPRATATPGPRDIRLIALDMDGTLLDGTSSVLSSSADAIRAALARGVHVVLATGKARPAAQAALRATGIAELASAATPGIFLQGLLVYGQGGLLLASAALDPAVVQAAFEYSDAHGGSLCAFLGDECLTTRLTPELMELHTRYHEPLPFLVPTAAAAAGQQGVRKLLFMADPERVDTQLKPHWEAALAGTGAETMQALPNMLEIVPRGWNKWASLQHLLADLKLDARHLMAVGDGGNDLAMIRGAGLGVAMGNAVPEVLQAADLVVPGHDDHGVAHAIRAALGEP
ncbi:hypothetical protein ACKKBG_A22225 [Auxenochlorella protothecoides x Auxenochlorella symbiontica]